MIKLVINTDGGSRGNPGPGAIGVVIKSAEGTLLKEFGRFIGHVTNNQAEYQALIEALQEATELNAKEIEFNLDSELVVKQINGEYKVKDEKMKGYYTKVKSLEGNFEKVIYKHVYREKNKEADSLVNQALDAQIKNA